MAARNRRRLRKGLPRSPLVRRLRIEPLEDRRLLSITVNTLVDESNGTGGGVGTSLREAIAAVAAGDTINFSPALTAEGPAIITLTRGQLNVTKAMKIEGPGADLLTIDASGNDPTPEINDGSGSRIFNVNNGNFSNTEVEISGLTLTGGDSDGSGGAIQNVENLTVTASVITGNSAAVVGGGISAEYALLNIVDCTISNNIAGQSGGGIGARLSNLDIRSTSIANNEADKGGGIALEGAGSYSVESCVIIGNEAGFGGGIWLNGGELSVLNSTVSGNTATRGGGIFAKGYGGDYSSPETLSLTNTTISGNSATQIGGGVYSYITDVSAITCTISGNLANGDGAGIYIERTVFSELRHTTITLNDSAIGVGAGLWLHPDQAVGSVNLQHLLVAGNTRGNTISDDMHVSGPPPSVSFSLIGIRSGGLFDQGGNVFGVTDPMLGPLANNGGPILTHAMLAGSPAIDAGDPSAVAGINGVPLYDQRGVGFARVSNARIDIGAFELQAAPPVLAGDYNGDGTVNAADYTVWRDTLGSTTDLRANGDASNSVIDAADYGVWTANFGETLGAEASASLAGDLQSPESAERSATAMKAFAALDSGEHGSPAIERESVAPVRASSANSQARMLALLDLLDSLPAREEDAEFDAWSVEREPSDEAQRDAAFAGLDADPIKSVSMRWP